LDGAAGYRGVAARVEDLDRAFASAPVHPVDHGRRQGRAVPWWVKLPAKVVLARVPVSYRRRRAMTVFRHGKMDETSYARRVFERHVGRCGPLPADWVGCELGPGDSVLGGLLAAAGGAARTYLCDVGAFASTDIDLYRRVATDLRAEGLPAPSLASCTTLDDVLRACRITYLTDGLAGLRRVPDGSIDACWSHAVLEHVRRRDIDETFGELARVTAPAGVHSHRVDLRDHFQGDRQNLRFGERLWESSLLSRSGFYTNRVQWRPMLAALARAGFDIEVAQVDRWAHPPIDRARLAPMFRDLPADELDVAGFDVVLRRPRPR
jgi:SAM-dependent methyltransferase